MLLGIIDLRDRGRREHVITPKRARTLLRFVYDAVYGDSYLNQGDDEAKYRARVAAMREDAERRIVEDVRAPCGNDFVDEVNATLSARATK